MRLRLRRDRRVAILGCGPAGLFAAHAFIQMGQTVSIFSKKRRSEMFGAQYLHAPIPALSLAPPQTIEYKLTGSVHDYAAKVYGGRLSARSVSPAYLEGQQEVWDIREAYYRAWEFYAPLIVSMPLDSSSIHSLKQTFDLVVSTIPAPALCANMEGAHLFHSETVWAVGDAPERGIYCPVTVPSWTVQCNGEENPRWYRASNVFGYKTAEWPGEKAPPVQDIAKVEKPISTTCDCWVDSRYLRAGRFGTWTKGVLSHEVYYQIRKEFK